MIEVTGLRVMDGLQPILHGIDLRLARGHVVGLMGPLASGKTTLLKALAGLHAASCESLIIDDRPQRMTYLSTPAWQARVGFAFQNNALFDRMTLFDNVAFPLRRRATPDEEVQRRTQARLRDVGLWGHRNKYPNTLSGGMQKRAGIARATVTEPTIGLFDDPLAGLDPPAATRIMNLIVGLVRTTGMGALVVSNDLPVLLPACQRVLMLEEGAMIYDGTPLALHAVGPSRVGRFVGAASKVQ